MTPNSGRIVFVTTELHPETPGGGAGVVVDSHTRHLGPQRGCVILLLTPVTVPVLEREGVAVVTATVHTSGYLERSRIAAEQLALLVQPGDRIEVQDFEGLGFWMLAHRHKLGLESVPITLRFHGPYDLLAAAMDTAPPRWALPQAMERGALEMADAVLVEAEGHRAVISQRYGVEEDRILFAPPMFAPIPGRLEPVATDPPVFAVLGRRDERKGSHDLVKAVLKLLDRGIALRVRFIGPDGWSTTARMPMTAWLRSMIPRRYSSAFEFDDAAPRDDLARRLEGVLAVVVPSRFETFCLVAYEARTLGLPIVVPDLPPFQGTFSEETGALVFDRSVGGLAAALHRLVVEPGLAIELARQPLPFPGNPWSAYGASVPVRHPRDQAGLATAAVKRVESLTPSRPPLRGAILIRRVLRHLPPPIVRAAARVTPDGLKSRLRVEAPWLV